MLFDSSNICPVCQTNGIFWCETLDWEYRTTDKSFTYMKCPSCMTLFIRQVPQGHLSAIYPPGKYYSFSNTAEKLLFRLKDRLDSWFYKSILKKIEHPTLSVLDIGGGTGGTLDVLKKADKRISYTEIVDIDEGAASAAKAKGYSYSVSTIEQWTTQKQFDVILLLNLVEHLANPLSVLQKAGEMLLPGGKIIVKTPNMDSLDAKLFKNHYWGGLHCPRHWVIFSDHSFRQMVRRTDLTIEKMMFTQGAPFWTYSVLQLFGKKNIHLERKPLIEHPLFAPLCIFFSALDITRSLFSKTSQMFVVLSK